MMFLRTTVVLMLLNLIVYAQKDPTASDAWAATLANGSLAVYGTINNPTMYDVYLVSGKSEAAGKVELFSGDKPVLTITVPAYGSAELTAGATFVRLSELKREVKAGDQLDLTLETDGGIAIAIAAIVK
jgi:periplasmic copper chaperone A